MRQYGRFWPSIDLSLPSPESDDALALVGEAMARDVEAMLLTPRYARAVAIVVTEGESQ